MTQEDDQKMLDPSTAYLKVAFSSVESHQQNIAPTPSFDATMARIAEQQRTEVERTPLRGTFLGWPARYRLHLLAHLVRAQTRLVSQSCILFVAILMSVSVVLAHLWAGPDGTVWFGFTSIKIVGTGAAISIALVGLLTEWHDVNTDHIRSMPMSSSVVLGARSFLLMAVAFVLVTLVVAFAALCGVSVPGPITLLAYIGSGMVGAAIVMWAALRRNQFVAWATGLVCATALMAITDVILTTSIVLAVGLFAVGLVALVMISGWGSRARGVQLRVA